MTKHNERCRKCKDTVYLLLRKIDGSAKQQHDLDLPARLEDYRGTSSFAWLESIHNGLSSYRGHSSFVKANRLPKVDYYLPLFRTVVEFDESQHFTRPRFVSLSLYPSGLMLGYDRQRWMELSRQLDKKDNDPPYRDEQRAWYDTLRDFCSVLLGNRPTVRIFADERQWCTLDVTNVQDVASFRALVESRG
jgi:hypothetical protein